MSYTLQAFILPRFSDEAFGPCVELTQGYKLLPVSRALGGKFSIPLLPLTDDGAIELPQGVEKIATALSLNDRTVAYIEAESFGGVGTQASVIWRDGKLSANPIFGEDAINQALRLLGVEKGNAVDEFAALDLGRYRHTEEWEESLKRSS